MRNALDLASALAVREQRKNIRPPARLLLAWVVSSTGATVTVKLSDDPSAEPVTVPKLRAYSSPAVNDVVILAMSGQSLYCLGALNAGAVPPPDPETPDPELPSGGGTSGGDMANTPPAAPVEFTKSLRPIFTGTYRADAWRTDTTDLHQGQGTLAGIEYGAAYYGDALTALGASEARSGTVRIQRMRAGFAAPAVPKLRLLTDREQPAGFPGYSAEIDGPALEIGESATVTLPLTWVAALLDGSAGGIGIGRAADLAYMRLAGPSSWSPAMELTLTYRS
jgi:hypothetical protein